MTLQPRAALWVFYLLNQKNESCELTGKSKQSTDAYHEKDTNIPLFVDLDGTLIKGDLLFESLISLIRKNVFYLFWLPIWLLKGKAYLKHEMALRCDIDVSLLPFHGAFVQFLEKAKKKGRSLILATASDMKYAREVADHLGLFDDVLASDGIENLSGERKRRRIQEKAGESAFDYAGNSDVDLAIWTHCRKAILVSSNQKLRRSLARVNTQPLFFDGIQSNFFILFKAMRIHQWSKNLLLMVPLLLAHKFHRMGLVADVILGFFSFGLCASSVYILNDLLDLETDRKSSKKKTRPFASGEMSISYGLMVLPMLLITAFTIAKMLPGAFLSTLAIYFLLTTLYSLLLKQIALLDVIILAFLYTIRIIAGGLAVSVPLSFWLLALSIFLFFSLALAKRYAELERNEKDGIQKVDRRGYTLKDMETLSQFGAVSGLISVLVLALYIHSDEVISLYSNHMTIWFFCPILLYWVSRIWLLTRRGELNEDPVVFLLFDRISHFLIILGVIALWLAI